MTPHAYEKLVEEVARMIGSSDYKATARAILAHIYAILQVVRPEMVEAVAKAINTAREQNGGPPYDYVLSLGKHASEPLFDEARAAIAAWLAASPLAPNNKDG